MNLLPSNTILTFAVICICARTTNWYWSQPILISLQNQSTQKKKNHQRYEKFKNSKICNVNYDSKMQ